MKAIVLSANPSIFYKMKKRILKLIAFAALIAVMLAGIAACEKEEPRPSDNENETAAVNPQETVADDGVAGEFTVRFRRHNSHSKGLVCGDQHDWIETDKAYFIEDKSKTFETMKVYRQSDPTKFFYIMTTNLDIPYPYDDYMQNKPPAPIMSDCWFYANDPANIDTCGWLYTRAAVSIMRNKIYMELPMYKDGKPMLGKRTKVRGRLPNNRDMADLLEVANEMDMFKYHDVWDYADDYEKNSYYDAFVFGLGDANPSDAKHSLGGYRDKYTVNDPSDRAILREKWQLPDNILRLLYTGFFAEKGCCGRYWMAESNICNFLHINRCLLFCDEEEWRTVFMLSGPVEKNHPDYGMSVRFVFEPTFK